MHYRLNYYDSALQVLTESVINILIAHYNY